jgi:hypothetical protein
MLLTYMSIIANRLAAVNDTGAEATDIAGIAR